MAVRCKSETIGMQAYERLSHHNFNGAGIQLHCECLIVSMLIISAYHLDGTVDDRRAKPGRRE
jgi:hypothetical protein